MSLKNHTINGLKWTTVSTIIVSGLQLAQISVLTQFLNAKDFGLMALVMLVIGFSNAFLDMGISNAIIYKQEITKKQLSSLYWVNVLAGISLFLLACSVAPILAGFYKNPKLTELIILVSITLLIQGFGQQFMVLWQKNMEFNVISKIAIVRQIITFVVAVFFAYKDYGVYALVFGTIAGVLVQSISFIFLGMKEYKPLFYLRITDIKEFISFGSFQMAEKAMNYFSAQFDTIIIGKVLGLEALGIYNVIKQIITKPIFVSNSIFNKVIFPMFSKIQYDNDRIRDIYMMVLKILTLLLYPILAIFYFYGYEIVVFFLGNNWSNSESLIKLFSIYLLFIVYGNPIGTILLAKGKANWAFYSNIFLFFLNPISMIIFIHFYGLNGSVIGFIFVMVLIMYPYWRFLVSKLINISFVDYYRNFFLQILTSFTSFGAAYYISMWFVKSLIFRLSIFISVGILLYLIINYLFDKKLFNKLKSISKV